MAEILVEGLGATGAKPLADAFVEAGARMAIRENRWKLATSKIAQGTNGSLGTNEASDKPA